MAHVLFKLKVGTTRRTSAFRFTAWLQPACQRFPNYSKGKERYMEHLEHYRVSADDRTPQIPAVKCNDSEQDSLYLIKCGATPETRSTSSLAQVRRIKMLNNQLLQRGEKYVSRECFVLNLGQIIQRRFAALKRFVAERLKMFFPQAEPHR